MAAMTQDLTADLDLGLDLGPCLVSDYVNGLTDDDKFSYFTKVLKLGFSDLEDDPLLLYSGKSKEHLGKWSHSTETWPKVEFGDIYMFLIDCPSYSHKALKAYKRLPGYNLYINGCLHQLYIRHSPTGHSIIMGRVNRSQDNSEETYRAWVGFSNEDGSIICGHCTCMAGDSSFSICDHAVAIIFQVEAARHMDYKPRNCSCCFQAVKKETEEKPQGSAPPIAINATLGNTLVMVAGDEEGEDSTYFVSVVVDDHHVGVADQVTSGAVNSKEFEDFSGTPIMVKQEETTTSATSLNLGTKDIDQEPKDIFPAVSAQESSLEEEEIGNDLNHTETYIETRADPSNKSSSENCQKTDSTAGRESLKGTVDNGNTWETFKYQHKENCVRLIEEKGWPSSTGQEKYFSENYSASAECNGVAIKKSDDTFVKADVRENLFRCGVCNKCKGHACNLQRHLRMHSGEKSFKCTECGKAFMDSGSLKYHVTTHTNEKCRELSFKKSDTSLLKETDAYKLSCCHVSSKGLCHPSHLEQHVRIHTGGKAFSCTGCGETFTDENNLRYHERRQKNKQPFICVKCGTMFNLRCGLQRHMKLCLREKLVTYNEPEKSCNEGSNLKDLVKSPKELCIIKSNNTLNKTNTGQKLFMCLECGNIFGRASNLKRHMRIHTGEKPFECSECGKAFDDVSNMRYHIQRHIREKPFICDECGNVFYFKCAFERHIKLHARENQFKSNQPVMSCTEKRNPKHHVRAQKKGKCDKLSIMKSNNIIKTSAGQKLFICHVCDRGYSSKTELKRHVRLHSGEKPLKCTECGKVFTEKCGLKVHMRTHRGVNCSKSSLSKSGFGFFMCYVCGKWFGCTNNFKRHMRIHAGERPLYCTDYRKAFSDSSCLRSHEKKHSGEKPYVCHDYGKSFGFGNCLRQHMKKHTVDKRFQCHEPGKTPVDSHTDRDHVKEHNGGKCNKSSVNNSDDSLVKPNVGQKVMCAVYRKSFGRSCDLRQHMGLHTGEKPFKCTECEKAFTDSSSCRVHVQRHKAERHNELICKSSHGSHTNVIARANAFKCPYCGKAFIDSNSLKNHIISHTDGKCNI